MPATRHMKKLLKLPTNQDEISHDTDKTNEAECKKEIKSELETIPQPLENDAVDNGIIHSVSSEESSEADSDDETTHAKLLRKRKKIQHKKQELIRRLKLHETANHLRMSLSSPKISSTQKRKLVYKKSSVGPKRKSLRLQKIEATNDIDTTQSNIEEPEPEVRLSSQEHSIPPQILVESGKNSAGGGDEIVEDYHDLSTAFEKINIKIDAIEASPFNKMLHDFKTGNCRYRKVVDKRIYSLTVHGRNDVILAAAASTSGMIGIWNLEESKAMDDCGSVYTFPTYGRNISSLVFPLTKPNLLYFSSYAGAVRALDLEKLVFRQCIIDDEQLSVSSFDFQNLTNDVIIAGSSRGDVIVSDTRSQSSKCVYDAHDRVIKSVSVHPLQRNYFATAGNDSKVKVFDFRNLTKTLKPVSVLHQHVKSVDSAYFSPLTGDKLLTTSLDNRIRIFDATNTSDVRMTTSISHNNHTGRWLSNFKATWHPIREDLVVVGSMNRPRQIDILGSNLETLLELTNEELQSVCSLTVFHPSRHVIVGGNSSGKVYVFGS